jgi:hypothetical protein
MVMTFLIEDVQVVGNVMEDGNGQGPGVGRGHRDFFQLTTLHNNSGEQVSTTIPHST